VREQEKRVEVLKALAPAFPRFEIDPRTYQMYANRTSHMTVGELRTAVGRAIDECRDFPSIAKLLELSPKRKARPNESVWGEGRPHMADDIHTALNSKERRFAGDLLRLLWRIERNDDKVTKEEALPFGLDCYGNRLYPELPLPQVSWDSADQFRSYYNAMLARSGNTPVVEFM
jgi:hypothetical protein